MNLYELCQLPEGERQVFLIAQAMGRLGLTFADALNPHRCRLHGRELANRGSFVVLHNFDKPDERIVTARWEGFETPAGKAVRP